MMRYTLIDAQGLATGTIIWDGEADWTPPEGFTVALEDSDEAQTAIQRAADQAEIDNPPQD